MRSTSTVVPDSQVLGSGSTEITGYSEPSFYAQKVFQRFLNLKVVMLKALATT